MQTTWKAGAEDVAVGESRKFPPYFAALQTMTLWQRRRLPSALT